MQKIKVAALTRYSALGASSRVRMLQYRSALESHGIELSFHQLLDDRYLKVKYQSGTTSWFGVLRAYARRAFAWPGIVRNADVLWVEKELWPWAPAWLEHAALGSHPFVLDYDDAIFHHYDLHPRRLVRLLWGRKIDKLMASASMVLAGNRYLAERAWSAGAQRVELLPTVIDLDRYPSTRMDVGADTERPIVIGWIGSPATVHYLRALAQPLARVSAHRSIELRVIGARITLPGVTVVHVPWSEADEVDAIASCDIGVMPLPDSPWERGKCGYKLIQYMACGLPVVASTVGVNSSIVTQGVNGYLASDDCQWEEALVKLSSDAPLRQRFGAAGRAMVEQRYSLQVAAPRLANWLHSLVGSAARAAKN
jgi:glycosyltransferase involved in cell wall biosynthesis